MDTILVTMEQLTAAHHKFIISRGGDIPWLAHSPDLSVCDYFLWAYLKSNVYLTKPHDIDELKNATKEEITATPDNMVTEATRTLHDRQGQCRRDGGHLRNVLFKK
jgi:hypothetical protein